ncbi:MAG: quinolinate synthase NadA [Armatimonadetes bacterium]|nr:quinolinate synthase NadA [Armatimonadota bacterium]MDW8154360.1 quinolinate synthase NadA [Armatimonadota bacterium]
MSVAAVRDRELESEIRGLVEEIQRLRRERNAVILAHNYQIPEIQDLADFVGDSLGLAQAAARTTADVIVFCGVHFMAETAAILCPDRTVLLPDLEAGCSLAATITAEQVRAWKREHPGAVVVAYVNTSAEVKAESDYCCTSTNAVRVVSSIPEDREILFLPDFFLGSYVARVTGRRMHLWMGECHVHAGFRPEDVAELQQAHPDAELLIHPECGCVSACMYFLASGHLPQDRTHILSTEGMVRRARSSPAQTFLVATETGILHRMRKEAPGKTFLPVREDAICQYMKRITLDKLHRSLREGIYEVRVDPEIAARARRAIERMLALS